MADDNIPREFRAWSMLEPEVRASLDQQVERALAKRSLAGAMVYCLVTVVVALSTRYYSDHRLIVSLTGCSVLIAGIVRIAAGRRLLSETLPIAGWVRPLFFGSIYSTAVVWGAFCAATVHLYRRDWTAMFLMLNTAALTAGASSSLAPSFPKMPALRYSDKPAVLLIAYLLPVSGCTNK